MVIIECPSCHTKFSVDPAQLDEVENPRFHCSRCDHLFELPSEELPGSRRGTAKLATTTKNTGESAEDQEREKSKQEEALKPAAEQLDFLAGIGSVKDTIQMKRQELTFKVMDGETVPLITAEWPDAAEQQQLEVDFGAFRSGPPIVGSKHTEHRPILEEDLGEESFDTEPEDEARDILKTTHETLFPFISEEAPLATPEQEQPVEETEEQLSSNQQDVEDSFLTPGFAPLEESSDDEAQSFRQDLFYEDMLPPEEIKPQKTGFQAKWPEKEIPPPSPVDPAEQDLARVLDNDDSFSEPIPPYEYPKEAPSEIPRRSPLGSLTIVFALPLIFLGALFWWSRSIEHAPSPIRWLASVGQPMPIELPPAGLDLHDLKSEIVTLDDGTKVLEVVGEVLNPTLDVFADIQIEAKLFDEKNIEIASLLLPAYNRLHQAQIAGLKAEMLMSMQKQPGILSKFDTLKPNEKLPVRFVLAEQFDKAVWFSARVYSVRRVAAASS